MPHTSTSCGPHGLRAVCLFDREGTKNNKIERERKNRNGRLAREMAWIRWLFSVPRSRFLVASALTSIREDPSHWALFCFSFVFVIETVLGVERERKRVESVLEATSGRRSLV